MQRIGFDFMTRRIRQFTRETFARSRQEKKKQTIEEAMEDRKRAAKERAIYVPVTRWGSRLHREIGDRDSRAVRRREMRIKAFNEITNKYPGELRRLRRKMAFDAVRLAWKQQPKPQRQDAA